MATRVKQQTIFTNNSQLILGSQNNQIEAFNNIQNNSQQDSLSSLSPIKIPQVYQGRSHSQHVSYNENSSPEISPQLAKQKRQRMAENSINLFQDTKQQLQQNLIESINNSNQNGLNQKQQQAPIQKVLMQDMLSDWLVHSNKNQNFNNILQKNQQGNNNTPSNGLSLSSVISSNINTGINKGNEGSIRQNLLSQIQQAPFQNIRRTENMYSSQTKIFPSSERSEKSTKKMFENIEKQITSNNSRNSSNNPQVKEQFDLQSPVKPRFNINQFQQPSQQQSIQDQNDQNQNGIENSQPVDMISQNLNGNQIQNKNSVQKWFNYPQQPDNSSNQIGIRQPSNSVTSTQPNNSPLKQQVNQAAFQSTLNQNYQKKLPEILNTNIPGKSGSQSEMSEDINSYMKINQNGLMIPIVKQNQTNINTYQSSIGTKPVRNKFRYDSLIPIENNSQQNNVDCIRDFLGISKPIEEKPPVMNITNQSQQNGNNTVGRFKIRKVSQVPEDMMNINQPPQQIVQSQIKNENQQGDEQIQSSLTNLPQSPLLSSFQKQSRNITPIQNSMPNLQSISELDQSIQSPEINLNNITPNNIENGGQNKKITLRKKLITSDNDINSNKLELIKLKQAWKLDIINKPQDEQQQEQLSNLRQPQSNMTQSLVLTSSQSQAVYNGENSGQFQYVKGAILKSKGILKSKSPDKINSQNNKNNEESKVPQTEPTDSRKNFHAQEMLQANSILGQSKLRASRKHNSMVNLQTDINAYRKKNVNFKETLRIINLNKGTESIETLKKPLTGSVIQ